MLQYTIGEMAEQAGVSVRTLHHYDAIGLLCPATRAGNGYRYYSEVDAERLHTILFYRALGFPLGRIAQLLQVTARDRQQHLLKQRELLDLHLERLTRMKSQLVKEIESSALQSEEGSMTTSIKFSVFDGFDPDEFADEVNKNWGDTDVYRESTNRSRHYTKLDWLKYQAESEQLNQRLVELMRQGRTVNNNEVLDVIEQMRLLIDVWFYPCSRQMHANLGEMYVADERFAASYEKLHKGMAEFMRAATSANLTRREV